MRREYREESKKKQNIESRDVISLIFSLVNCGFSVFSVTLWFVLFWESFDVIESRLASESAETTHPQPPPIAPYRGLSAPQWGMIAFLLSEAAFFSTLVMVYIVFIGADNPEPGGRGGPTPRSAVAGIWSSAPPFACCPAA